MFTDQELIDAGFKRYDYSVSQKHILWQKYKCVDEKEYFINICHYTIFDHQCWELKLTFETDFIASNYCWITMSIKKDANIEQIEHLAEVTFIANRGLNYG